jgi:O-antigen ligase
MGLISIIFILTLLLVPFPSRLTEISRHKNIRIGVQLMYIEVIKDHPLTGIGFGMQTYTDKRLMLSKYNDRVPQKYKQQPPVATPHNTFVDVATRTGLVGLSVFLWITLTFSAMIFKLIKAGSSDFIKEWGFCILAGFVAFLIQAFLHDATYGIQATVQYLLFAMGTILWKLNRHSENLPSVAFCRLEQSVQ